MKNKKDTRIGEIRRNKQGLTMKIVKYINNKTVTIRFMETGEEKVVRYIQFTQGSPRADILKYPPNGDAPFKHAVVITIGILTLTLSAIGGLIYWICK